MLKETEIDLIANRVAVMFGRSIGLTREKIQKCVVAVNGMEDEEVEEKLRRLL